MPEYLHQCTNIDCNNEWWDEYSIKDDPPEDCPKCGKKTARRLIAGCAGKVELFGRELIDKVKEETKQMKKELLTSEDKLANFVGEDKYNSNKKTDEKMHGELKYTSKQFRRVG